MAMLTHKILLLIRLLNIVTNMLCGMMTMNHNFNTFFFLLDLLGHFIDYLYIYSP